ncbi:MAG: methyltransferase domain-containing protein [Catenulispora sp.]|nr:methyltransferase domain-containing protein [Catenulispora sp.]
MPSDTAYHGALGDHFAQWSSAHPTNAYIDRPAMLALIGDVAGLDVLDVGCGSGFYSAAMVERGARVTGIDGSETLLRYAEKACGGRATFVRHDLEQPLPFADAAFDLAVMALVYGHVYDREQLLRELRRVLRPGARLLVSTTHPVGEQRWLGGSYYEGGRVDAPVGEYTINFERMTVERFVNELLDGGFVLERLLEPRPVEALRDVVDAEKYERIMNSTHVLTVAMRRPAD